MKTITKEETLNNRFCKYDEVNGRVTLTIPTKEQALKMRKRTLCLFIASSGLKFRDVEKATENANYWLTDKTKEEIINLFF